MKTHDKARTDGILSAEELEQAIAEYKASRNSAPAEEPAQDDGAVEAPAEEVVPAAPAPDAEEKPAADGEETASEPSEEEKPIEAQVEELKAQTDGDIDTQKLFDIIDTLLAEREFNKTAAGDGKGCVECDSDDAAIPTAEPEEAKEGAEDPIPAADESDLKTGEVLNADSVDKIVSAKIDVGMIGKALNMDGLETMRLMDARKAIIKAVRPSMNLDGRSEAFINAAYEIARDEVRSRSVKDTSYQKNQMFNGETRKDAADTGDSAEKARERMMARQQNKNKEDK